MAASTVYCKHPAKFIIAAKGESRMLNIHEGRPTVCCVDLAALRWNFGQIKRKIGPHKKILPMVKASAYGHGAVAVARTLADEGAHGFGVATFEEAVELRQAGIRCAILVVAGAYPEQVGQFIERQVTAAVHDRAAMKRLDAAAQACGAKLAVHIKIDTGMGRLGFLAAEIDSWLPEIQKLKALKVEGVFSHFSQAESVQGDYTQKQLRIFHDVVAQLRSRILPPPIAHLANSAATITLPGAYFDMVRPGIMLYGAYPSREMVDQIDLRPVMSWKTCIAQLKKVPAGTSISYGQTFVTQRESVIATLPVGYADGYKRLLSNRGAVLIKGRRAPIAGRVCMDLTMVDVTDIANVQPGDEVVLLGRQAAAEITADEMAAWADTISYEIFTSLSTRVPRIHL
jgi:alanine racemase